MSFVGIDIGRLRCCLYFCMRWLRSCLVSVIPAPACSSDRHSQTKIRVGPEFPDISRQPLHIFLFLLFLYTCLFHTHLSGTFYITCTNSYRIKPIHVLLSVPLRCGLLGHKCQIFEMGHKMLVSVCFKKPKGQRWHLDSSHLPLSCAILDFLVNAALFIWVPYMIKYIWCI